MFIEQVLHIFTKCLWNKLCTTLQSVSGTCAAHHYKVFMEHTFLQSVYGTSSARHYKVFMEHALHIIMKCLWNTFLQSEYGTRSAHHYEVFMEHMLHITVKCLWMIEQALHIITKCLWNKHYTSLQSVYGTCTAHQSLVSDIYFNTVPVPHFRSQQTCYNGISNY